MLVSSQGRRAVQGEGEPGEVRGAGRLEQVVQVADRSCVTGRKGHESN